MNPTITHNLLTQMAAHPHAREAAAQLAVYLQEVHARPRMWGADPDLRRFAIAVLRRCIGRGNVEAVSYILQTIGTAACECVPELVRVATDNESPANHRLLWTQALCRVGRGNEETVTTLIGLLDEFNNPSEDDIFEGELGASIGELSARTLGRVNGNDGIVAEALSQVCEQQDVHPRVLIAAACSLWRLNRSVSAPSETVRRTVTDAAIACLSAIYPRACRFRGDPPTLVANRRTSAVRLLAWIGAPAVLDAQYHLYLAAMDATPGVCGWSQSLLERYNIFNAQRLNRGVLDQLTDDPRLLGPLAHVIPMLAEDSAAAWEQIAHAYITSVASTPRSDRKRNQCPPSSIDLAVMAVQHAGAPLAHQIFTALDCLGDPEAAALILRELAFEDLNPLVECRDEIAQLSRRLMNFSGRTRLDLALVVCRVTPADSDDHAFVLRTIMADVRDEHQPEAFRCDAAWALGTLGRDALPIAPNLDAVAEDATVFHTVRTSARTNADRIRQLDEPTSDSLDDLMGG